MPLKPDNGLGCFDGGDHGVEDRLRESGHGAGVAQHFVFHEGIAGAHGDAVAAGDAAGFGDRPAAIPEDAWVRVVPVDAQGFVDLEILASFDAASAEDALVGIVTVEGVAVDFRAGIGLIRDVLFFDVDQFGGVVDRMQSPLFLSQTVQ